MRIESSYNSDLSEAQIKAMKRSGQMECETCKNRKYKDGSDEANVSYKGATHIDPSGAASKVMAHEQEKLSMPQLQLRQLCVRNVAGHMYRAALPILR